MFHSLLPCVFSFSELTIPGRGLLRYRTVPETPAVTSQTDLLVFMQGGIQNPSLDLVDTVYEKEESLFPANTRMVFFDYCSTGVHSPCTLAKTRNETEIEVITLLKHLRDQHPGSRVYVNSYSSSTLYVESIAPYVDGILTYAPITSTFQVAITRTACLARVLPFANLLPADTQRFVAFWSCGFPCDDPGSVTCFMTVLRSYVFSYPNVTSLLKSFIPNLKYQWIRGSVPEHASYDIVTSARFDVGTSIPLYIANGALDRITLSRNARDLFNIATTHNKTISIVDGVSHVTPLLDAEPYITKVIVPFFTWIRSI